MPLSDSEQIEHFLVGFQKLRIVSAYPSDHALELQAAKLDRRLYPGFFRLILSVTPQTSEDDTFWGHGWIYNISRLLKIIHKNSTSYTEDDTKNILLTISDLVLKDHIVLKEHAVTQISQYDYKGYLRNFIYIISNVLTFLKQERLVETYRPELEKLYESVGIWGNYEPYDQSYEVHWEMDALLFGENTTNLAALVQRYGREPLVPLAKQGNELMRAYHEELGNNTIQERDNHPCVQLLVNQIVPPLHVAFVRALLRSDIRLSHDGPLFKAFMTLEQPYTPAAIHEILQGLNANCERHGLAFQACSGLKPSLLQLFISIEREQTNLERHQIEEDVRNLLRLLSKIVLQKEQEKLPDTWPPHEVFLITLSDLLVYMQQETLITACRTELEELYATANIWDNFWPSDEAYRLHWEIDRLLFGENTTNLASLVQRYANETEVPLAEQANELLHAYHEEAENIISSGYSYPHLVLMGQVASTLQIALIKALLLTGQNNEPQKLCDHRLFEMFFQEKQPYTPDDIHEILHLLNTNFALYGTEYLERCHLSSSLMETFCRILQEQASVERCRTALETMYSHFSTRSGYGSESPENKIRLLLRQILFPAQEGELTTLLQQYKKKTSILDKEAAEAILAALHIEQGGLDLFISSDSWERTWSSWVNWPRSHTLVNSDLGKQLAKTFAGSAKGTLVVLALQEAVRLCQRVLTYTPPLNNALIELAYIRQDIQMAVALCPNASYAPGDVKRVLGYLLQLLGAFDTRLKELGPLTTQWTFTIVRACKPSIVQADTFTSCETELKQLFIVASPPDGRNWLMNTALDRQYRLLLTELLSGNQQKFDYPLLPDAWGKPVIEALNAMADTERKPWLALLQHCTTSIGSKPSRSWQQQARMLVDQIGLATFTRTIQQWLYLFDRLGDAQLDESTTSILQGLIWCCAESDDRELCLTLVNAAIRGYRTRDGQRPLAPRVGNACVGALGTMPGMYAIGQLERLRYGVKQTSYQQHVQMTIEEVAKREGLTLLDLQELAIYDFELQEGLLRHTFGPYTAQITVTVQGVQLQWYGPENQLLTRRPAEIKRTYDEEWRAFEFLYKGLEKTFVLQRRRLERLPLNGRRWPVAIWQERYLQHPLVSILARNLIWQIRTQEKSELVIWHQGRFINNADQPVELASEAEVQLWHPLMSSAQEVQQWRLWLEQHRVIQPFKQAHRELYRLEELEQAEGSISLRYAGHYLRQYQFSIMAGARDWQYSFVSKGQQTWAILRLPHWKCRAEFEVKVQLSRGSIGSEADEYEEILTGALCFLVEDETNTGQSEELPFEQVPPLVLSEVVRDLDLFVSVTSVARNVQNEYSEEETPLARYMQHYGFGELSTSGYERKEFLQRLVPGLVIAERCSFQGSFLQVRGDLHVYKIHLGSSNVLIGNRPLPLSINQQAHDSSKGKYFLPFEGDMLLSEILSKMFLLANDNKSK